MAAIDDVIIVGGGPTGFINALGLAQAGLRVTVIEAEAQINDSPRAAVYFWSVLDGLERLGILEEAERIGFRKQDYTWLVRKTGERIACADVCRVLDPTGPAPPAAYCDGAWWRRTGIGLPRYCGRPRGLGALVRASRLCCLRGRSTRSRPFTLSPRQTWPDVCASAERFSRRVVLSPG